jgi:general secretion pathway protein D
MRDLRDARNALQRIVTGQNIGNVQEVPDAKSFVVTDFAPNVVSVYRLLRTMDVRPSGKEVTSDFIPLKYATSDEVEPVLTDLFTGRQRVTQVPRPQGPQGGGGVDIYEDIEPRIISDPRTNMIIVYATQEDILEIKEVIAQLDVPIFIQKDRVHVIRLKNLDAEATAEVLRSLIDATTLFGSSSGGMSAGGAGARPGRAGRAGQPGQPAVAGGEVLPEEEQKPAVVAEMASNSLVIAATERQFEELKKIVLQIDVPKNQVLIEAALVELTLSDAFTLAFELGLGDDKALTTGQGVSGAGFTTYGLSEFVDVDGDTFFTDRLPNFISQGGPAPTGLVGGIFAFGQVPLLFNILNSTSQSRILQLPSITVADNQEAQIKVSELQATTTTSTTGTGIQTGGFEGFEEAGTTLTISPHIADDFNLLLDIKLEVSAFVGNPRIVGGAVVPADQLKREIYTQVSLPDRHTVVLGGLLGQNQRSTVDKTPVLADVPVLGHLFKSTTKNDRQTSLFLFVTPTILPGREDSVGLLDEITCKRKQKADELIGYTEIFGSNFVGCETQDPATGCIRGSGSASDRLDRLGAFESTRFCGVSEERLARERAARREALHRKAAPVLPKQLSAPPSGSASDDGEGAPPVVR